MKIQCSTRWMIALIATLVAATIPLRAQQTLIPLGAVWKYLDDGSDQGTDWRGPTFIDTSWASGPAELGFGDGFEATTNRSGFITYYYRQSFTIPDASSITNLRARIKRDDGAVAYLNGVEVFRDNMPAGAITAATLAATTAADDGQSFFAHSFSAAGLVNGDNVLAVEVHQSGATSTDISFDLELVANPLPSIAINTPTNNQTIASSTVTITGTAIPAGTNVNVVQAFVGTTQIGQSTSADFSIQWQNVDPGGYTVVTRVIDNLGLAATSAPVSITVQAAPATMLVPRFSTWKYENSGRDLSTNATDWRFPAYNDSAWGGPAPGPLGDNLEGANQLCASVINIGPTGARFPVVYYRKTFNVSGASSYGGLTLRLNRDDSAVVWLNGTLLKNDQVTNPNVFEFSGAAISGADETTYWEYAVPSSALINGVNVLAVENHQANSGSSDLQFDLELEGSIDLVPPSVVNTDPSPGGVVLDLKYITVEFSEPVSGVNASDLLINSEPATNLVVISPIQYTFYFPTPGTGLVRVAWAPTHGIADLALNPNPFGGGSWTYTYNTNLGAQNALIISEFMANNNSGIKDDDSSREDWIEIYNPGPTEQNMDGWFLTDDPANLTKWRFPAAVFQPNTYTIVWASSKDRRNPTRPLHTNFKLSSSSNTNAYLALLDPRTNIVSSFVNYPPQTADVSYGRDKGDQTIVGFFSTPTPRAQNSTSGAGFANAPAFSIPEGIYTNDTLSLVLSIPGGGPGTIRYTLDGTVPTGTSLAYGGPITISANTTVKARVFVPTAGVFPSAVVGKTYLLLDASARDFNSGLPVLIISSIGTIPGNVLPGGARASGQFAVIDNQGGRAWLRNGSQFQQTAAFEIFGQTSAGFPKVPYNIEIQDPYGNDDAASILGLPADADWKLRNPYSDKCMMNDFLAYELFEQMGNYSCRRRLVEVFVHQGGGKITYPGDYSGIETLFEKIEISGHRVDLQKMSPFSTTEPEVSGGYIFKKDKDSGGDLNFSTSGGNGFGGQNLKFHDPKPRELTAEQIAWLPRFMNQMETALYAPNWLTAQGTNHYSYYLDPDGFVEQYWIVEFAKQIDGYRLSDYFSKDRKGRVTPVPIWDWNLSFGNADYLDGGHYSGWYWALTSAGDHPWVRRLLTGSTGTAGVGDPDFCQKVADRWGVLRTNVMNGDRVNARINEIAAMCTEAAVRDFARFPRLGSYIWPNPTGAPNWDVNYRDPLTYEGIISEMKKWVSGRYNWIESQFTASPTFSVAGGNVSAGTVVTLVAPGANIYYTLDGTDPRGPGGVTNGILYTGPITVNANTRITARAKRANGFQNTFSPIAANSYATATPGLRITEIMYHPANAPAGNTNDADNFEFIEVENISGTPLNVNRFQLSGGIQFQFPNVVLDPGQSAVIVADVAAFTSRYGVGFNILGTFTGHLDNGGERLVLSGGAQEPILDFSYQDNWYPTTDGPGFSLVIKDPVGTLPSNWGLSSSWRVSAGLGGSPGSTDPAPPARPGIVINEVRTASDPLPDAIEIYNPTIAPVSIGGWFLTDDFDNPKKFIIPPTTIGSGQYVVFTENDFNANTNDPNSFALDGNGDQVYLFSGNGVDLTGYIHGFDFGASERGVTFGRHVDSTGDDHLVAQTANSIGGGNSGPLIGPIIVSEFNYHPPDYTVGTNGLDNTRDEFIELRNISGSPVSLFDSVYTTNTWHLRNAVDFDFPANVTIPAGGFALVVGFNPGTDQAATDAFRARMNVAAGTPIFGPWTGLLQNDAEQIELRKPRSGDSNGTYVLVERINYSDSAPWPVGADGLGLTLHRVSTSSFADDPASWAAGAPTPGAAYFPGTAPSITAQPFDQTVVSGTTVTLNGGGSGSGPLRYQWYYQGEVLAGATNSNLVIPNMQLSQAGLYNIEVINAGGYAFGTGAVIHARIPLQITSQPRNATNVLLGATTNFTVGAVGQSTDPNHAGGTKYQWYFNGALLNNQTNAVLTLTGVQLINQGSYYCVIRDDGYGDILTSDVVTLAALIKPGISLQPFAFTAVEGGRAYFSLAVTGSVPVTFLWRAQTNGAGVTANLTLPTLGNATNSVLMFNNLPFTTNTLRITCAITNLGGNVVSSAAFLTILKDSDHDGLPDLWETNRTGFNINDPNDGARDDDHDGLSNRDEYIAGTDFNNSNSVLRVTNVLAGRLTFAASSNRTYTVQYTDNLRSDGSTTWNKLADILGRSTSRTETVIDPNANSNRFYRIVIPIQP